MFDFLKSVKFVNILAITVILLCFGYFFEKGLDNGLIAVSSMVVSYFFGSSLPDKNKPQDPKA